MTETNVSDPAVIDELARAAVQVREDASPEESQIQWGALWRVVLDLDRWFFVRDDSEVLRPGMVTFNGKSAVPVFTDIKRAIAFADGGRGGANKVFASPPAQMLTAAGQLTTAGVDLLVFNIEDAPFGAPPEVVQTLASDLARLNAQNAAQRSNMSLDPAEETILDRLAVIARDKPTENAAQSAMWREVFALDNWFFIPRGGAEQFNPYAITMDLGPAILAFSTPARAAHFAQSQNLENADQVLGMPAHAAAAALANFTAAGVKLVHFDPQNGAFTTRLEDLKAMLGYVTGEPA
ncbi:hypothetical protein SAMN05216410_1094 [Sanguibacter gelidistatuariae]|uniref:SseB protein N-terminal domain-containing protein n=1 Tax=Sanguibacter gelidistatuariae TaxID=1814289 RepID=A0A1G6HKI7_9MICO|nr:hypothetical protein [Sanguibacter gelidistatuariae]SDB94425.1 hypothetical protein SAMN05216410_1094 [Sanguibacter gelidistatuariae]